MDRESLKDCFQESVMKHGGKIAITFLRGGKVETETTYLQLDQDSNRLANTLLNAGAKRGDRIILFLDKSLALVVAHLAIQKIGAVSIPLNPDFKRSEVQYLLRDADASLVVSGPGQEEIVRETGLTPSILALDTRIPYQDIDLFRAASEDLSSTNIGSDDAGIIIYTSGTTGEPKGVILTQENLVHDALRIIETWEIRESDMLCHALPLFHVHGMCFALHTLLIAGGHVLMLDRFSPEAVVQVLGGREKGPVCSLFMAVPSMYGRIMDHLGEKRPYLGHIRLWTSGSAPLLPKDFERIKSVFGKEPVEREGMSETGMNFSNPLHGIRKPGSIGLPLKGLQVRIVDPVTFNDVPSGQKGEIWLKGPGITPGYWGKPEETKKAFEKGWFRTGDLGRVDEDGYYYITDRIKHIIISGGENISPKEVETVINRFDGVVESCVVGIPDAKWGEKVVAAVVTGEGQEVRPIDILKFCKEHLHDWKCPKEITLCNDLPKNRMGKVLIEEVKRLF